MKISKIVERMVEIQQQFDERYAKTPEEIIAALEQTPEKCCGSEVKNIACDLCRFLAPFPTGHEQDLWCRTDSKFKTHLARILPPIRAYIDKH